MPRGDRKNLAAVPVGSEVAIQAVVVEQRRGQTVVMLKGVGGDGLWSMVGTAEVEVVSESTQMQREAMAVIRRRVEAQPLGRE